MTPTQPLVAFVCVAPVLSDALTDALSFFAEVCAIPAGRPDPDGLIRALRPDALVIDDRGVGERLTAYAREARIPLVLIATDANQLCVRTANGWVVVEDGEGIAGVRNLLVAQLLGRGAVSARYALAGEATPEPA